MSRYELLLTLHVIAAIVWLGSAVCVQLLGTRADRTGDPARKQRAADDAEWLALRLFVPASLSVLVLGILLVLDGPWEFDQTWILLGLAGYAFSFLVGILYMKPESDRIKRSIAAEAFAEAETRIARITLVSRIELAILFLVVIDMIVKPGL
jgi:uncharacterized membrane protein